jgi:hypothetical protein
MFSFFVKKGEKIISEVEVVTSKTTNAVDGYVKPVRTTLMSRFPITFLLLVTFGVTATFLGLEQVILKYALLQDKPEVILLVGISILAFTGTIHKKLG